MKKILLLVAILVLVAAPWHYNIVTPPAIAAPQPSIDYPAIWRDSPKNTLVDSWGYQNRTCASYVAYKIWKTYHVNVSNWGDGTSWLYNARLRGLTVDEMPSKNSVIVYLWPPTHAQWIDRLNKDGTVHISQYDGTTGKYSEQDFNPYDSLLYHGGIWVIHFN